MSVVFARIVGFASVDSTSATVAFEAGLAFTGVQGGFFLKNVNYQFFNDQGSAKATGPTGLQQRFNKGSSVILCRFGDFHDIFAKPPCSY